MTNLILTQCVGAVCTINMGSFGTSFQGLVLSVEDHWMKVERKGKVQVINCDFIQSISIVSSPVQR